MTATPEILPMSPTQIEENKKEEPEIFESIEETNLPLLLDSGVTAHVQFESGGPTNKKWGPTNNRSQGNSEIVITEFNNKFNRLLLIGSFQQAHPANLLTR